MRKVTKIIVHCSATPPDMDIGADTIRGWHVKERGFRDVGYHYVIRRDGNVEPGRPLKEPGAHAFGHNSFSVGICWVGGSRKDNLSLPEDNRTEAQEAALCQTIQMILQKFPGAEVLGHRDLPEVTKYCPSFDVKTWFKNYELPKK